jgi:hypothetical protein
LPWVDGRNTRLVRTVRAQGKPVRALVRPTSDADRVADLRHAGVR